MAPPDACTEDYAHNAIGEGVHGCVDATKDNGAGVDRENNSEDGVCLRRYGAGGGHGVDIAKEEKGNGDTIG